MVSGQFNYAGDFGLIVVPPDVYVKFIHAFVQPPDK